MTYENFPKHTNIVVTNVRLKLIFRVFRIILCQRCEYVVLSFIYHREKEEYEYKLIWHSCSHLSLSPSTPVYLQSATGKLCEPFPFVRIKLPWF